MKELIIGFLIALVISSYMNGSNIDSQFGWNQAAASLPGAGGNQGSELIDDINEGTFQGEVLDSHEPVLVEFYSQDCVHCTNMKPELGKLAQESQGYLKVYKVDAKANGALAERYEVMALPGFVLFSKGKPVNSTSGEMSKQELSNWVKKELDIPVS
ncbi:MAG TPA: thioredoxin family protein [Candidatus Obscuribacter sp.]|nr:thioredoxin family protein [Candidatus Obscuribacter sp.]HMY02571.1 thioredoxin family protein [Candidatus Obscuribacter sp.]HMY54283.1 thioredoxin family protein [Candidatus Obscuribacter sp.]HNA72392.1 thioredoxin family protein [Candidatus Obscuribacter sp.]HND07031.1 thioredoxin family protein [Candidatus Obscuribacter sp.]